MEPLVATVGPCAVNPKFVSPGKLVAKAFLAIHSAVRVRAEFFVDGLAFIETGLA
jgi:hypothetical protein